MGDHKEWSLLIRCQTLYLYAMEYPQGKVITAFFLDYINDISSNIDIKTDISLFTDDTKIFVCLISL